MRNEDGRNTVPKVSEPIMLIASFGFSCYIFWEFLGLLDMLPFLPRHLDHTLLLKEKPWGFLSLAISFLAALRASDYLIKHIGLLLVIAAATSFLTLISSAFVTFYVEGSQPFSLLTWIFYGLSLASGMLLWAVFHSYYHTQSTQFVILVGFIGAITVFFGLSLIEASSHVYLFIGFLLITATVTICSLFLHKPMLGNRKLTGKPKPARWACALHNGTFSILYGFLLSYIVVLGKYSVLIAAGASLAGCIIAWLIARRRTFYDNVYITRFTFVATTLSLLLIQIIGPASLAICTFIIIGACFCTALTSWIVSVEVSSRYSLNPISVYTRNKAPGWVGIFLGITVGSYTLIAAEDLFLYVLAMITALICVTFAVLELSNGWNSRMPEKNGEEHGTRYRKRCQDFSEIHHLSARELDVLYLLAKGKNAESIASELFIAKPTAKTHIQHIYQKANVNSQQALIEAVEQIHLG